MNKTKNNSFKLYFSLFIVFCLLLSIGFGYLWFSSWISLSNHNSSDIFVVENGETLTGVSKRLANEKRIRSRFVFYTVSKFFGLNSKLKAGQYQLEGTESFAELYRQLSEGRFVTIKLTIPEGYTNRRIAGLVRSKLKLDSLRFMELQSDPEFLKKYKIEAPIAEGYLLPETYEINWGASEEEVLDILISSNKKVWTEDLVARMKELKLTKNQVLTMASIVEGEAVLDKERERIAGVYWNRVKKGIPLGADPTIQYLLPDGPRRLLFVDLEIKSPYNTYRNKGLPPGPIGNPGAKSIVAALYPEKNDYLYFVADGYGGHVFTKTLIDHNKAAEKYKQLMKPRRLEAQKKKKQ